MSNLLVRILTAAVGVPIILGLLFWVPPPGFYLLCVAALMAAAWEAHAMGAPEDTIGRVATVIGAATISFALYFAPAPLLIQSALAVTVVGLLLVHLLRIGEMPTVGRRIALSVGVALYAGVLPTFVGLLHRPPYGPAWVVLVLTVTWLGDTGAYAAGRLFGRHKLYPIVSPGKTWEG